MGTTSTWRPSSLDKINECSGYENSPFEAGVAAMRGTIADEAFRHALGGHMEPLESLDDDISKLGDEHSAELTPAAEGIKWALDYVKMICGSEPVTGDENLLRIEVKELFLKGTMDASCDPLQISFDLKTGMFRSYMAQMAAYALGKMDETFSGTWTMYLLFSDQREAVCHHFTYEEALKIVTDLRAKHIDPSAEQTLCEYCGWCGKQERCSTRLEAATRVLSYLNLQERWELIQDDPHELGEFLTNAVIVDDFVKIGKRKALEFTADGVKVEGWSRVSKKGNRFVPPENVWNAVKKSEVPDSVKCSILTKSVGKLGVKGFEELASRLEVDVEDRDFLTGGGSTYMKKVAVKKKK